MSEQEQIEYFYNSGKMPLRYYNQLNGKTAQENYNKLKNSSKPKQDESFIMYLVRNSLQATIKTALDEILKGFNK